MLMNDLAQTCLKAFGSEEDSDRHHTGKTQAAGRILAVEVVLSVVIGLINTEMEKNMGCVQLAMIAGVQVVSQHLSCTIFFANITPGCSAAWDCPEFICERFLEISDPEGTQNNLAELSP